MSNKPTLDWATHEKYTKKIDEMIAQSIYNSTAPRLPGESGFMKVTGSEVPVYARTKNSETSSETSTHRWKEVLEKMKS